MHERVFTTTFFYHVGGDADGGGTVGDGLDDDRVCPYLGVFPYGDIAEDFCARTDNAAAFNGRMALARVERNTAEGDPLVDDDVIFDNRGLPDHNARSVVYKNTSAYRGTGVDVDVGEDLVDPHEHTREAFKVGIVEFVGYTVPRNRPDTRVVEKKIES